MDLADLLTVHRDSADCFHTTLPAAGYLFGGCTLAIALRAASETVPDAFEVMALQMHYLRAGEWGVQTELDVARSPDGRSFTSRGVTVRQGGRVLATLLVSCHVPESGGDWQGRPAEVPGAESLPPSSVLLPEPLIEVRRTRLGEESMQQSWHPYWARAAGSLGGPPALHQAALSFISDYLVINSVHDAPGAVGKTDMIRTLNHSLWFHRPIQADRWHLFTADPVSVSVGRGLTRGLVFSEAGSHVASFIQEVVVRPSVGPAFAGSGPSSGPADQG